MANTNPAYDDDRNRIVDISETLDYNDSPQYLLRDSLPSEMVGALMKGLIVKKHARNGKTLNRKIYVRTQTPSQTEPKPKIP
jgi:hypothetical protein